MDFSVSHFLILLYFWKNGKTISIIESLCSELTLECHGALDSIFFVFIELLLRMQEKQWNAMAIGQKEDGK